MSPARRTVRAAANFFEDLDRQLPAERGPNGEPSTNDFQTFELLEIVDRLPQDSTSWVMCGLDKPRGIVAQMTGVWFTSRLVSWFYDDDVRQDESDRAWLHEEIPIPAPFDAWAGANRMRRYDLFAKVQRALGVPSGELEFVTEQFTDRLINKVEILWSVSDGLPSRNKCRQIIVQLFDEPLMRAGFKTIVEDFGWRESLYVEEKVTLVTCDGAFREQFALRLSSRLLKLIRKMRNAEDRSAA